MEEERSKRFVGITRITRIVIGCMLSSDRGNDTLIANLKFFFL